MKAKLFIFTIFIYSMGLFSAVSYPAGSVNDIFINPCIVLSPPKNMICTLDKFNDPVFVCKNYYRPSRGGCVYDVCRYSGKVFQNFNENGSLYCTPGRYNFYQTEEREDRVVNGFDVDYIDNLWFAGNHIDQNAYDGPSVGWFTDYIWGTDLGFPVEINGRIFVYFGDTFAQNPGEGFQPPNIPRTHPNCHSKSECNDAIVEINVHDNNPKNGISVKSVVTKKDHPDRFHPIIIPGVHRDVKYTEAPFAGENFQVPTGATTIKRGHEKSVVLSYKTEKFNRLLTKSWFGCSKNGIDFDNCYSKVDSNGKKKYFPFSTDKFLRNSLIFMTKKTLTTTCKNSPSSILCKSGVDRNGGLLIFGIGKDMQMYLAFIKTDDIGKLNNSNRPRVKYYSKTYNNWVNYEKYATKILNFNAHKNDEVNPTLRSGAKVHLVQKGGYSYFIIFQVYKGSVFYRTAEMINPATWSSAKFTKSDTDAPDFTYDGIDVYGHYGYGIGIFDKYTTLDEKGLHLWHLLSSWEGEKFSTSPSSKSPYGVYSTETIIPWPPVN